MFKNYWLDRKKEKEFKRGICLTSTSGHTIEMIDDKIYPPWNTETYFDEPSWNTYPNILEFKTPKKDKLIMTDGKACESKWKRLEFLSECGTWLIPKKEEIGMPIKITVHHDIPEKINLILVGPINLMNVAIPSMIYIDFKVPSEIKISIPDDLPTVKINP